MQLLRFAAGCLFPSNVQRLADLQPATLQPWPVTAHWSNKIAGVFSFLKASDSVPGTSRAGRFPSVQQQQSWPLLLHKPPVVSAREIASLARVQAHGGAGAALAHRAHSPSLHGAYFTGECSYPPSATSGGLNLEIEMCFSHGLNAKT